MNNIKGIFKKSIYKSDDGYIIGLFKVVETDDETIDYINTTITFTGNFHELHNEEKYIFNGEFIQHKRFGKQFSVSTYEKVKKEDKEALVEFLSSDLFFGIGERFAGSIVDTLGLDVLNKVLINKEELMLVPKMTKKKALVLYEGIVKYEENDKIILEITKIGFDTKTALSIYNFYKQGTMNIINENIYDIINDIDEINFSKVDSVRENMEIDADDERRISALIIQVMKDITFDNGDTYSYIDEIMNACFRYLGFSIEQVTFTYLLNKLNMDNKIKIQDDKYYLNEQFESEVYISNHLYHLCNMNKETVKKFDMLLSDIEKDYNVVYNEEQKRAIKNSLSNNLTVITGGPGTGKTTIIKAIVEMYRRINKLNQEELSRDLILTSPTGRASKRMMEQCMIPAYTIHRFLKWNKENNSFNVNEYNKHECKFIIIDEFSMVDNILFSSLLKGLHHNTKILIVGDSNQLPSVSQGQVLKDIIESEIADVIKLETLYRQSADSYIPELAQNINLNEELELDVTKDDFTFIASDVVDVSNIIKSVCKKAIEKDYTYKDIQLIAPMYKGENGIDNLNIIMQEIFNKQDGLKKELLVRDVVFRENDKILLLTNMPDDNVFNGDIGYIVDIDINKKEITIEFDMATVTFEKKDFIHLKHGYAITIHKSQGSEFKLIIMPIDYRHNRMLDKKLIYTGITRAKRSLIIVGDKNVFIRACHKDNDNNRKTSLKDLIIKNYN